MIIPQINYSAILSKNHNNTIYTLDCSILPYGTHKDLKSAYIIRDACMHDIHAIHLITSGNAGLSLKNSIRDTHADIFLTCIVPQGIDNLLVDRLRGKNSRIMKYDLEKKDIFPELSAVMPHSLDVTYVTGNPYRSITSQIDAYHFDYIILPLGSGELFNCYLEHIQKQESETKLIGIIPLAKHPLSAKYPLWNNYSPTLADKLECKFMDARIYAHIMHSFKDGHRVCELDALEIRNLYDYAKQIGLSQEPSGAVGLHIPPHLQHKKILCVLTGNGISEE